MKRVRKVCYYTKNILLFLQTEMTVKSCEVVGFYGPQEERDKLAKRLTIVI